VREGSEMKLQFDNDWSTDWNLGEGVGINIVWNGVSLFHIWIMPMHNYYSVALFGFGITLSREL